MNEPLSAWLPAELQNYMELKHSYQAKQIFKWINRAVFDFEKMTDLSITLRKELALKFKVLSSTTGEAFNSGDGTIKYRIKLSDGLSIETVLLTDQNGRKTICVSSQVGCKMACSFCRTGLMKFTRNLEWYEIVEQYLLMKSQSDGISHIVFMGMGEPLDNLVNVKKAIAILNYPDGAGISLRRITISTCGLTKGIRDLAENGPGVKLAVSLITANPALREKLMPVTKSNKLPDLKNALIDYQKQYNKRITFEVVLLKDVNTFRSNAAEIAGFIKPLKANINVIPWNEALEIDYKRPDNSTIEKFKGYLEENHINVTQRFKRGGSINAACGQLCALDQDDDDDDE